MRTASSPMHVMWRMSSVHESSSIWTSLIKIGLGSSFCSSGCAHENSQPDERLSKRTFCFEKEREKQEEESETKRYRIVDYGLPTLSILVGDTD